MATQQALSSQPQERPHCDRCGERMNFVRDIPKAGPMPELNIFICDRCGHVTTLEVA